MRSLGFRVWGLRFSAKGLGFRALGSGFRVSKLGFLLGSLLQGCRTIFGDIKRGPNVEN